MGVLVSNHFKANDKLQRCSVNDQDHIVPGSSGEPVRIIQEALTRLLKVDFPPNEVGGRRYGQATSSAVERFKAARGIRNFQNQIDNIVGQKTVRQLDLEMKQAEGPAPVPPPKLPLLGTANVHIGPFDKAQIPADYYHFCGLETVGPGQVETGPPKGYTTFEGLIDTMSSAQTNHHVVVNHGDEGFGLLVPLCPESTFRQTGLVIGGLAELADQAEEGTLSPNSPDTKVFLGKGAHSQKVGGKGPAG